MWKEIWHIKLYSTLQFMLLNMLETSTNIIHITDCIFWLWYKKRSNCILSLYSKDLDPEDILGDWQQEQKDMFSCDVATEVAWHSAACVRGNLSAAGLPGPTYMSVHDSERQDDTLFHWFRISRNNSHTDLPVVHWRQPVPTCFIYECLMSRYPLCSVTLVNWQGVLQAPPHAESAAQL